MGHQIVSAQDEATWKPQMTITGYVNTIAEYTDLKNWVDIKQNVGIGLSEAAFLASYKPLKKLEFKGTMVYFHKIRDIQSLLVEAYGTYTINPGLKLGAGKYLTPLSPVNQYFYAPMNTSATLPMLVSHHFLLPQSFSGFQVSGEFGTSFKTGYNVTYGNYMDTDHPVGGIFGLQGMEDLAGYITSVPNFTKEYLLGGCARIYGNYNDILNFGLNYFDGRRANQPFQELTANGINTGAVKATKYTFGVDMELKLPSGLKVNAEYWMGEQKTTDLANQIKNTYKGYYGEVIYEKGIFSPYLRYDYVEDVKATVYMPFPDMALFNVEFPTKAYTAGIAIRPIYEVLLKLEYKYINNPVKYSDVNTQVLDQIGLQSSNPLNILYDHYNYFIASLVFSF